MALLNLMHQCFPAHSCGRTPICLSTGQEQMQEQLDLTATPLATNHFKDCIDLRVWFVCLFFVIIWRNRETEQHLPLAWAGSLEASPWAVLAACFGFGFCGLLEVLLLAAVDPTQCSLWRILQVSSNVTWNWCMRSFGFWPGLLLFKVLFHQKVFIFLHPGGNVTESYFE